MNSQGSVAGHNPGDSGQAAASKRDGAGIKYPPPLIYLVAVLIGAAIDRFISIRVLPASLTRWIGGALVLLAISISALGSREFIKAKTTFRTDRRVPALVTTGPFRYSRNPLYLSLSVLQLGVGIWMNSVWVVALLVPVIAWIRWQVIAREERYLTREFGQVYLDYQARVHRWL